MWGPKGSRTSPAWPRMTTYDARVRLFANRNRIIPNHDKFEKSWTEYTRHLDSYKIVTCTSFNWSCARVHMDPTEESHCVSFFKKHQCVFASARGQWVNSHSILRDVVNTLVLDTWCLYTSLPACLVMDKWFHTTLYNGCNLLSML